MGSSRGGLLQRRNGYLVRKALHAVPGKDIPLRNQLAVSDKKGVTQRKRWTLRSGRAVCLSPHAGHLPIGFLRVNAPLFPWLRNHPQQCVFPLRGGSNA